jgi:hypothetical protein
MLPKSKIAKGRRWFKHGTCGVLALLGAVHWVEAVHPMAGVLLVIGGLYFVHAGFAILEDRDIPSPVLA